MSVFFCDSNCELWHTKTKELGVQVISMPYTIQDKMHGYDLGEHHDFEKYFRMMKEGEVPTTQALNAYDYCQYFEPFLEKGEDILYVHFSHKLSGTFSYLQMAIDELAEKYPQRKITLADTLSISIGAGMIVYEAAKLHNSGASDQDVVRYVENNRKNFALYFAVDDLTYLKRGGRISSATAFFGSMLNVKPILKMSDEGTIINVDKAMGRKKSLRMLLDILKDIGENIADYPIAVLHAMCGEDAKELYEQIRQYAGEDAEIWFQPVGPTVGAHCGPGTIGIGFHSKRR